jgi:hypothetical protein
MGFSFWGRSRRWMWDMRFKKKIIQSKQLLGCLIKVVPYMSKNTKNSYNSYSFNLISLAMCCTLVAYINRQKKRLHHIYFWDCQKLDWFYFLWANQSCPSQKKTKLNFGGLYNSLIWNTMYYHNFFHHFTNLQIATNIKYHVHDEGMYLNFDGFNLEMS